MPSDSRKKRNAKKNEGSKANGANGTNGTTVNGSGNSSEAQLTVEGSIA